MGNARPRPQHQSGHTAYRNVSAHAGDIDHDKGPVQDVDLPLFDKENGEAIFDGDRFEGWEHRLGQGPVLEVHHMGFFPYRLEVFFIRCDENTLLDDSESVVCSVIKCDAMLLYER